MKTFFYSPSVIVDTTVGLPDGLTAADYDVFSPGDMVYVATVSTAWDIPSPWDPDLLEQFVVPIVGDDGRTLITPSYTVPVQAP